MKKILLFILVFSSLSCAHSIHLVHATPFEQSHSEAKSTRIIEARSEQQVIFYFAFNTDYVDEAYAKLQSQCPGKIEGVTTQFSTSLGFFSWTNKILMKALCKS